MRLLSDNSCKKGMIKAVIFDMDGLLIDSEPFWQEAEIKAFTEAGVPVSKEMTKETIGMRVDAVVDYWFSRYSWKNPSKEMVEKNIIRHVIELIREKGEAMPGAKEAVEVFVKEKIPIAIASSSAMEIIRAVLGKVSIERDIKIIYSAENELYGKPHPGVYITTANKLGVRPEECLVFEDSVTGLLAAKAALMKCIAVPNRFVAGDNRFWLADMTLKSLKDFHLGYLKNLN